MVDITVTTTGDVVDAGDGETSLREAIALANSNADASTIIFAADPGQAFEQDALIRLTQGELTITEPLTLDGASAGGRLVITADAAGDDVTFAGTDITDLAASNSGLLDDNSRIIASSSATTLIGLTLTGGVHSDGGAAINASGDLSILDTTLAGNSAAYGGAIRSLGQASLSSVTLANNSATNTGGALFLGPYSTSTLVNVTIANNSAANSGGAILNGLGELSLLNSTITGNTASVGGGIYFAGDTTTLENSIVLGNSADTPVDAEITNYFSGSITAENSILGLVGELPADVFAVLDPTTQGGLLADNGGDISTVALRANPMNPALDIGDSVLVAGEPVSGDARGESRSQDQANVDNGGLVDAGSFELQDGQISFVSVAAPEPAQVTEGDSGLVNVSFTLTRTLDAGPASVDYAVTGTGASPATADDFGGALPAGTANFAAGELSRVITIELSGDLAEESDEAFTVSLTNPVGVFLAPADSSATVTILNDDVIETPSLVVTTTLDVVDNTDGETSLREAVALANADPDVSTISFASGSGDAFEGGALVRLTQGVLNLTSDVIVAGGSAGGVLIITGDAQGDDLVIGSSHTTDAQLNLNTSDNSRIFAVNGTETEVVLDALTLTGGFANGSGAGANGGAIAIGPGADATLTGVSLVGNRASQDGGGVFNDRGNLILAGVTVSGNRADDDGGGVGSYTYLAEDQLTLITNTTIYGNRAGTGNENAGGGVFNDFGIARIHNSTIANNTAGIAGGVATYADDDTRTEISSTIIAGNTALLAGYGDDVGTHAAGYSANSLYSLGNNLIGDGQFNGYIFLTPGAGGGDLVGTTAAPVDAGLGNLSNNGGIVATLAPLPGSSAIDSGNNGLGLLTDATGNARTVDQLGEADGLGGATDVGALEVQAQVTPPNAVPIANDDALLGSSLLKLGEEFLVNTTVTNTQANPVVSTLVGGSFVIAYIDGSGNAGLADSIRAQVFSSVGDAIGTEILVSAAAVNSSQAPVIAVLENGGFVIAYESAPGGDGSGLGVRAQVFDSAGMQVGVEQQINTVLNDDQRDPVITGLTSGGFVVVYEDDSQTGLDDSSTAIRAGIFDATGARVGLELLVNTTTNSLQFEPTVTALAGGGFVIVFDDFSGTGGDASPRAVRAQVFSDAGEPNGVELLVNTTTNGDQFASSVTALDGGGFVVVYVDASEDSGPASLLDVRAQLFDAQGAPVGTELLVNSTRINDQFEPVVSSLDGGGFVVVYGDDSESGGDGSGSALRGQLFDAVGAAVGSEILVNSTTAGNQQGAVLTRLDGGGFVVAFTDFGGSDGSAAAVRGQVFDAFGMAVGEEFQANTTVSGSQFDPVIATLRDGSFVIAFDDDSQSGADSSGSAIRAQIFTVAVAEDELSTQDLLANDSDRDGDTLTIVAINDSSINVGGLVTLASGARVALNADGTITYDPNGAFDGLLEGVTASDSFIYTVSDGQGGSAISTALVNLVGINEAPVITTSNADQSGVIQTLENTLIVDDFQAIDDSDSEAAGSLTYSLSGGADATAFVIDAATGELSFRVAPDFENPGSSAGTNSYEVEIAVTDSSGGRDTQPLIVNVTDQVTTLTLDLTAQIVSEANGVLSVGLSRSGDLSGDLEVDLALSDVSEATIPDSISLADGVSTATFTITAIDDDLLDGDQNVSLTATAAGDTPASAEIDFTVADDEVAEAASFVVTTDLDVVDSLDGLTSLREAVSLANAEPGINTISFDSAADAAFADDALIRLTQGALALTSDVVVAGSTAGGALIISGDALADDSRIGLTGITDAQTNQNIADNSRIFVIEGDGSSVVLDGLSLTGGVASGGDGVANGGAVLVSDGAELRLSNSALLGNRAQADGGGLYNDRATLVLDNVTLAGNRADDDGGGIATYTVLDGPSMTTITNTTISENSAGTGLNNAGGGVFNYIGVTLIQNSTIAGNSAGVSGGVATYADDDTRTDLSSTIVANNSATSGYGNDVGTQGSGYSSSYFSSLGNNLIGDGEFNGSVFFATQNTAGDIVGTAVAPLDPRLGVLGDNGGEGATLALLPSSPAIDQGNNSAGLMLDATGGLRSVDQLELADGTGDATDIGALELQQQIPANSAPTIAGGAVQTLAVVENTEVVQDLQGVDDSDSEQSGLLFSFTTVDGGGADNSQFALDPSSGFLSFSQAPDFENPGDGDGDNSYQVQVTLTDSQGLLAVQNISVNVTDESSTFQLSLDTSAISENDGSAIGSLLRVGDLSGSLLAMLSSSDVSEAVVPAIVELADGEGSASFVVSAVDDFELDGPQSVEVSAVLDPLEGQLIADLIVTDDEVPPPPPALSVADATPQSLLEAGDIGVTELSFPVNFDTPPAGPVEVSFTVDINGSSQSLTQTIAPTGGVIVVEVANDAIDNGTESVTVTLTDAASTSGEIDLGESVGLGSVVEDDGVVVTPTTVRVQAEAIEAIGGDLTGFIVENRGAADEGQAIRLPSSAPTGSARFALDADLGVAAGVNDITVQYFDESDGVSTLALLINGQQIGSEIVFDDDGGSAFPNAANLRQATFAGIVLQPGDEVEIVGTRDGNEPARLDFIEFNSVGSGTVIPNSQFAVQLFDSQADAFVAELFDGADVSVGLDTPANERTLVVDFVGDDTLGVDDGSILIELRDASGDLVASTIENEVPNALFGSAGFEDLFDPSIDFVDGDYSLQVTAFSDDDGLGDLLATETIQFTLDDGM